MDRLPDFADPQVVHGYFEREPKLEWIAAVRRWLPKSTGRKTIADLGCGGGSYGLALARHLCFERALLVDSSPEVIRRLSQRQIDKPISVVRAAVETWIPDDSLDVVLLKSLVHHLSDYSSTLRRLYSFLSPGGSLMVQTRTSEQAAILTEMEFFLAHFTDLRHSVRDCYPSMTGISRLADQLGAELLVTSYVDQWEVTVDRHLARLASRRGFSLLWRLTDADLSRVLELAVERYAPERRTNRPLVLSTPMALFFLTKPTVL